MIESFPKKLPKTGRKVLELTAGERYKILWNDVSFFLPCGSSSGVEHHVANVVVVGSNPISRFFVLDPLKGCVVMTDHATFSFQDS